MKNNQSFNRIFTSYERTIPQTKFNVPQILIIPTRRIVAINYNLIFHENGKCVLEEEVALAMVVVTIEAAKRLFWTWTAVSRKSCRFIRRKLYA